MRCGLKKRSDWVGWFSCCSSFLCVRFLPVWSVAWVAVVVLRWLFTWPQWERVVRSDGLVLVVTRCGMLLNEAHVAAPQGYFFVSWTAVRLVDMTPYALLCEWFDFVAVMIFSLSNLFSPKVFTMYFSLSLFYRTTIVEFVELSTWLFMF